MRELPCRELAVLREIQSAWDPQNRPEDVTISAYGGVATTKRADGEGGTLARRH